MGLPVIVEFFEVMVFAEYPSIKKWLQNYSLVLYFRGRLFKFTKHLYTTNNRFANSSIENTIG